MLPQPFTVLSNVVSMFCVCFFGPLCPLHLFCLFLHLAVDAMKSDLLMTVITIYAKHSAVITFIWIKQGFSVKNLHQLFLVIELLEGLFQF